MTKEALGIKEEELTTSWRTLGRKMTKFFKDAGSWMADAVKMPALPNLKELSKKIADYAGKIKGGAVEMWRAIRKGDWNIFKDWARDDPLAAGAGIGAVALAGGVAVGALTGIVGAGAGLLGWATTGGTGILGAAKAGISIAGVGSVLGGLTTAGKFLYNFEWQESDAEIDKAIDQAINNLYEPMGEFLGRSLAGMTVGGLTNPPRIEVNITQIALMAEINEDIADDLYDAVTDFIHVGMSTLLGVAIKLAYKNIRGFLINAYNRSPAEFKKAVGGIPLPGGNKLGESIEKWGSPSSEPWSIKRWLNIEEKVEQIEDEKVKGLVEGFLDGFWDQWQDSVVYTRALA